MGGLLRGGIGCFASWGPLTPDVRAGGGRVSGARQSVASRGKWRECSHHLLTRRSLTMHSRGIGFYHLSRSPPTLPRMPQDRVPRGTLIGDTSPLSCNTYSPMKWHYCPISASKVQIALGARCANLLQRNESACYIDNVMTVGGDEVSRKLTGPPYTSGPVGVERVGSLPLRAQLPPACT